MRELKYIAVEGPIGVGKTTLSKRLTETMGSELLLESPETNPFLEKFYQQPDVYALPTQLCFLLQRARQIDGLRQRDLFQSGIVADFLFDKDRVFAQLTLNGHEWDLYDQIYQRLAWEAPVPDLVIYLHASVDVLVRRVHKRARKAEEAMSAEYLDRVARSYATFFRDYRAAPLITVNAEHFDLVNRQEDYNALLDAMSAGRRIVNLHS